MNSSPTRWINVLDVGARADGVTDDGPAIQAALDAAPPGATVHLPLGRYAIRKALRITGSRRVVGDGAFPRWGRIADDWNSINTPVAPPWVDGTVILQQSPGENAIELLATGETQHLEGFAVVFDGEHAFRDTGHGILAEPLRLGDGYDKGLSGALWSNLVVVGHDGDHYAVRMVNGIYNDVRSLQSFGGGVLHLVNDSVVDGHYGNSVYQSLYGQLFVAGGADGIRLESVAAPLNMLAFVRPQVTVNDMSETFRGVPPATSRQQMLRSSGDVRHVSFLQFDFESGITSGITPPESDCWMDPAGILYSGDHRGMVWGRIPEAPGL
jgi:hypothetical protein